MFFFFSFFFVGTNLKSMSTNEPLRFARVEVGVQGCKFCDQHGKSLTDEWLAKHAVTYITFTGPGKEQH